jgi:hypothetical protein
MPNYSDWNNIWQIIYKNTGWSYSEAYRKIYFIGHHMSQSPALAYETFNKVLPAAMNPSPDGFLVSNRYFTKVSKKQKVVYYDKIKEWLKLQNLPNDFINAIELGHIELGKNLSDEILIVPFFVKDQDKFPRFFHNTGEGYQATLDNLLLSAVSGNAGVVKVLANELIFKWNECPGHGDFCSTGASVRWEIQDGAYLFKVKIVGSSLSQLSPWISPNWTQAWIKPYLKIQCGHNTFHKELISSVGFRRLLTHNSQSPFFQGNNSLLAPFERSLKIPCKEGIKRISLGREGSEVDQIVEVLNLSHQELSYDF